jgi:hypothetical protein
MRKQKIILFLFLSFISPFIYAQNLYSEEEVKLDFTAERIDKYNTPESWIQCNKISKIIQGRKKLEQSRFNNRI